MCAVMCIQANVCAGVKCEEKSCWNPKWLKLIIIINHTSVKTQLVCFNKSDVNASAKFGQIVIQQNIKHKLHETEQQKNCT